MKVTSEKICKEMGGEEVLIRLELVEDEEGAHRNGRFP